MTGGGAGSCEVFGVGGGDDGDRDGGVGDDGDSDGGGGGGGEDGNSDGGVCAGSVVIVGVVGWYHLWVK